MMHLATYVFRLLIGFQNECDAEMAKLFRLDGEMTELLMLNLDEVRTLGPFYSFTACVSKDDKTDPYFCNNIRHPENYSRILPSCATTLG